MTDFHTWLVKTEEEMKCLKCGKELDKTLTANFEEEKNKPDCPGY